MFLVVLAGCGGGSSGGSGITGSTVTGVYTNSTSTAMNFLNRLIQPAYAESCTITSYTPTTYTLILESNMTFSYTDSCGSEASGSYGLNGNMISLNNSNFSIQGTSTYYTLSANNLSYNSGKISGNISIGNSSSTSVSVSINLVSNNNYGTTSPLNNIEGKNFNTNAFSTCTTVTYLNNSIYIPCLSTLTAPWTLSYPYENFFLSNIYICHGSNLGCYNSNPPPGGIGISLSFTTDGNSYNNNILCPQSGPETYCMVINNSYIIPSATSTGGVIGEVIVNVTFYNGSGGSFSTKYTGVMTALTANGITYLSLNGMIPNNPLIQSSFSGVSDGYLLPLSFTFS